MVILMTIAQLSDTTMRLKKKKKSTLPPSTTMNLLLLTRTPTRTVLAIPSAQRNAPLSAFPPLRPHPRPESCISTSPVDVPPLSEQ